MWNFELPVNIFVFYLKFAGVKLVVSNLCRGMLSLLLLGGMSAKDMINVI